MQESGRGGEHQSAIADQHETLRLCIQRPRLPFRISRINGVQH